MENVFGKARKGLGTIYSLCGVFIYLFILLINDNHPQATVLLNANVAFLAVPLIISGQGAQLWASPAQVASLVSIVTSMGSIVLGLLLVRQHRATARESAEAAVRIN